MTERLFQVRVTDVLVQRIGIINNGLQLVKGGGFGITVIIHTYSAIAAQLEIKRCRREEIREIIFPQDEFCAVVLFKMIRGYSQANAVIIFLLYHSQAGTWLIT